MHLGVDYYPEHWNPELWPTYASWMREAGFNVVRLAEFAWVKMEPREGAFDFAWLDLAIATLEREGISVVLGTPTGAMPAWLVEKDDTVLAREAGGHVKNWGSRKANCFSSSLFRERSRAITRAMAEHYGNHPAVIGWQTDNEFSGPECHCPRCRTSFQAWLKEKYTTIRALNEAWGTAFWSLGVSSFEEIRTPTDNVSHNPGACLDYKRFNSWIQVDFQRELVDILRPLIGKRFITHNTMGFAPQVDCYELSKDLDFAAYDSYILGQEGPSFREGVAASCDLVRGFKGKNFWIMEQSAGPHGWTSYGRTSRPGELRSQSFQHVAHGADGLVWFRWRSATIGREQYWHGILGHDGVRGRRFREVQSTCTDLARIWGRLEGSTVAAPVALIYDYDSLWAMQIQPSYGKNMYGSESHSLYQDAFRAWHGALTRAGIAVDVVPPTGRDLSTYPVVVAPHLHVLPDGTADALVAYVENGGVLVTDTRTAVKDGMDRCHPRTLPGRLAPVLGISIEEYEALGNLEIPVEGLSHPATAMGHIDWVVLEGAEALATLGKGHLVGRPVFTHMKSGRGHGFYLATRGKEGSLYDQAISAVMETAGIRPVVPPVPGLEQCVRQKGDRRILFLLNHKEEALEIPAPAGTPLLCDGKMEGGRLSLPAFGVAVVEMV